MSKIPTISRNPNGLHQRFTVRKANGTPIDPTAEYFVLRLDENGKDPRHAEACRKAILVYAEEIKDHLPMLAKDIVERYGQSNESAK